MGLQLAPKMVADIEWAVVSLTGLIAVISLLGALYSVPWTFRSRQQVATRAFNYLWVTRALLQIIAACYALSLDLRLQVLWSAKLYIGLSFGLLEPSFLLLVLFACMYTVHKHTQGDPGSNPNLFIFALTVGLTLPMCAAQVFAALFSRIMTQLRYNEELMFKFFAASQPVGDVMCPLEPNNPNCAVCLFPEFSTLISAAFALLYLLVLWAVLGRIAHAAINRMLARRIRFLQICITVFFCASVTLRGVTVVDANPYSLPFVCLWLANVAVGSGLILVVSVILVWVPVYDGRLANTQLGGLCAASTALLNAPTELLPLVGYGKAAYSHDAGSSDYEYGGSQAGDQLEGECSPVLMMTNQLHHRGGGSGAAGGADTPSSSSYCMRPDSAASVSTSYARGSTDLRRQQQGVRGWEEQQRRGSAAAAAGAGGAGIGLSGGGSTAGGGVAGMGTAGLLVAAAVVASMLKWGGALHARLW
ncbi:hypothetical protein COO60DRAFT_1685454 [Scenedesmus sp. NREL 46B-D3]|nr:hypothetical protein COO60DRAFT_1685454 [Scenedesmus sp. NREL 46B-D3]